MQPGFFDQEGRLVKLERLGDPLPRLDSIIDWQACRPLLKVNHQKQRKSNARRKPHPLGKCITSVSLQADILTAMYADALPLCRLEKILARYGGNISRTAMANWIIRLDDVFKPLINLLQEHQRGGDYLQADETRIQVLKEASESSISG